MQHFLNNFDVTITEKYYNECVFQSNNVSGIPLIL